MVLIPIGDVGIGVDAAFVGEPMVLLPLPPICSVFSFPLTPCWGDGMLDWIMNGRIDSLVCCGCRWTGPTSITRGEASTRRRGVYAASGEMILTSEK